MAGHRANRIHVVLIPGFAGFDALGQLEYYAGVTPVCDVPSRDPIVLHYFDNFPTAAVVTRATRLRSYLAKRIARGEILQGDEVVLIGHSTGGLDIRWLLWDLRLRANEKLRVDGGVEVKASAIRDAIRRIVFLSVPHWGTNIADWVRGQWLLREIVVADLQAAVAGSQCMLLDWIETAISGGLAQLSHAGLFRAAQDALAEANEHNGKPGSLRKADAHEAASELALYLRHMASDFRAIDDLASAPFHAHKTSPAHFDAHDRLQELEYMGDIEVMSYVTVGKRPFRFEAGQPAPAWELSEPWTHPEWMKDRVLSKGTDIAYRTCYRACAGGPFRAPDQKPLGGAAITRRLASAPPHLIELWDNDGIVNTLSMLWPRGENVLVAADHMDIVGHYRAVRAQPGDGRIYRSYDLLNSGAAFGVEQFRDVWHEIFAFAAGRVSKAAAAA